MKTKSVEFAGIVAAVVIAGLAVTDIYGAFAQGTQHSGHGNSRSAVTPKGDRGPSSVRYATVNAQMHAAMDLTYTGNPDRDFVRGMMAHHQGAVEMAKVVLQFGKDPEVRKLAENIIKSQEEEIAWMKNWLEKNASK